MTSLVDLHVLVTGGAGYIGSHTVLRLLEEGARVTVVDNLDNSSPEALERVRSLAGLDALDPRLTFARLDVRDVEALDVAFRVAPVHAVVHFAGRKAVAESVEHPLDYFDHNVVGSLRLLQVMQANEVSRLVFSSSATVYGEPDVLPITEEETIKPINPYGQTKAIVEAMLAAATNANPTLRVLALRYFNPVGAHPSGQIGEDPRGVPNNLMPFVMQVAVGRRDRLTVFGDDYGTPDGTCIRDYIHVMDLADAHVAAVQRLDSVIGCQPVNVGRGNGASVFEVVAAAERAVGRPIPRVIGARRPGDAPEVVADVTQSGEVLGWRAGRGLDDMCRDHWNWQQSNPEGYQ